MKDRDFGWAIRMLKAGNRVCRKGWNGKGMWLHLVPAFEDTDMGQHLEHLELMTAQGAFATWAPSGSDALAEDWELVE